MNFYRIFIESLIIGILAVALWVLFWTLFVPQMLSVTVWPGHESLVLPVFAIVCVAYIAYRLWPIVIAPRR